MNKEIVIVSAVRTPVGSFGGSLSLLKASELGAIVIAEAVKRAALKPEQICEVVMGNVLQAGCGQGPARQASVQAGIPIHTPAYSINILCGSGLKSVIIAAQSIISGDAEIVVAGGMESMSSAAYTLDKARTGYRLGDGVLTDTLVKDGLTDAFENIHMGITAENLAEKYSISASEQNEFALASQLKAVNAIESGYFKEEIIPVVIKNRKGDIVCDTDEYPKKDSTIESLNKLKPAFKKDGTVTAGNASGINDGAAALVLMTAEKAKELGLKPMAKIVSWATSGVEPSIMGIGPVPAVKQALKNANMTLDQVDLIEANEAFAAQCIAVDRELKFDKSKLNIQGGAIALGHPIGASGARILTTLLYSLKRNDKKIGLATLCVGGGMGVAMIIEKVG